MPAVRSFVKLDAETKRAAIVIAKSKIFAKRIEATFSKIEVRVAERPGLC
jgi:hypothetical protein